MPVTVPSREAQLRQLPIISDRLRDALVDAELAYRQLLAVNDVQSPKDKEHD
jgi:hypothetical protein